MTKLPDKLAAKIAVYEYERGWGSKFDDHMICMSNNDALKFMYEFNKKNDKDVAPDWYMVAEGSPELIGLNEAQYAELVKSDEKRIWWSSIKNIK